jgi:CBS domain-containing protein
MKYPVVCIESSTSIQNAIQSIERSPYDAAFIIDENGFYQGGVSIMDLRRLLISGVQSEEAVGGYPVKHVLSTEESIRDRTNPAE